MAKLLTVNEIREAAEEHGIEYAALKAVISVESGGSGYLPDGRAKILFERHYLWKRLQTRGINPRTLAQARPDLCGAKWDPQTYPYGGQAHQWDRVLAVIEWAQAHDPEHWESYKKAAYESCSWGLFQLMGSHYATVGYANVYDFKHAMEESERNQLNAILVWMQGNGLLKKLKAKDWAGFARGYNGSGQVTKYAWLLKAAYERSQRLSG